MMERRLSKKCMIEAMRRRQQPESTQKKDKKHFYTVQDLLNVHERYWSIQTRRMDQARLWADKKPGEEDGED